MNGDGLEDILIASYNGVPQWIERTKEGYEEPTNVLDKNDDLVVISTFWDYESEDWGESEETGTHGHCTSVASVDWDHDGDMDLLLGCYRKGGLFLRLNEGSPREAKFASTNEPVEVAGEPIAIKGGIGAPQVADWDGDGLFDILIGTIEGEVTLLRNAGEKGKPKFLDMTTLVERLPGSAGAKTIKRVPAEDGSPIAPGSSFHIEVVDYDGDGDLDLLVGGRSEWLTGPEKSPTPEDLVLKKKLIKEAASAWAKFAEYRDSGTDEDERQELKASKKYKSLLKEYHSLRSKAFTLTADPTETADLVWLFRKK